MSTKQELLNKAAAIRKDVAYDTKWGTAFPYKYQASLQKAADLERLASALDGEKKP